MQQRQWTTREVQYLHENANEGAESIAKALNRSVRSVECCASRYGVSLRKRWICPKCGHPTFSPLSPRYGWCRTCSIEQSQAKAQEKGKAIRAEILEEEARLLRATRARQAVYSKNDRKKKKLCRMRELREEAENLAATC